MVRAERRRISAEKELRGTDCLEMKRRKLPADLKAYITRSRFRKGRWLFPARLLAPL